MTPVTFITLCFARCWRSFYWNTIDDNEKIMDKKRLWTRKGYGQEKVMDKKSFWDKQRIIK
ncbi:hypothetical protein [Lachnoclostridium phytofermentans]|uniref:hypothetical protein n=1 Tax=Lachnoclostridium phytofermentans TaxID=66219 RepID=UPI0002F607B8|nr:hypothetical protein [Lachnoclostridium phytofermentans]